jgi:hypothetical protein
VVLAAFLLLLGSNAYFLYADLLRPALHFGSLYPDPDFRHAVYLATVGLSAIIAARSFQRLRAAPVARFPGADQEKECSPSAASEFQWIQTSTAFVKAIVLMLVAAFLLHIYFAQVMEGSIADDLRNLRKGDAEERLDAIGAIKERGSELGPAVSSLMDALRDEDADVRRAAVEALAGAAPSNVIVAAIVDRLDDPDYRVRGAASAALNTLLKNASLNKRALRAELLRALDFDHASARAFATYNLAALAREVEVVPQLTQALQAESPRQREAAGIALRDLQGAAAAAVPALAAALEDEHQEVRIAAATTLGQIGADSPAVLTALRRMQTGASEEEQQAATNALGHLAAKARGK